MLAAATLKKLYNIYKCIMHSSSEKIPLFWNAIYNYRKTRNVVKRYYFLFVNVL